jgi:hypothetical protein
MITHAKLDAPATRWHRYLHRFGSILAGIIDQIEENLLDHRDICVHLRIVSGARSHLQDQCQQEDSQAFWRP